MATTLTDNQYKKQPSWLSDYQWKPGHSGNPKGRPKGQTLKEWAKGFLRELPDDRKLEFLRALPPEIVWKMAEGNPTDDLKVTGGLTMSQILTEISENGSNKTTTKRQKMEIEQSIQDQE